MAEKKIIEACLDTTGPAINTVCSECPASVECDIEEFKDRVVEVDLSPSGIDKTVSDFFENLYS